MKDNIIVGALSGLIGGVVGAIFSHSMFLLGLTPISSIHLAATLIVIDILNLTTLGFIDATLTHLFVSSFFGVLLTYILIYAGKDFWPIKGTGFGILFCLIAHSYLIPLLRAEEAIRALLFNTASWTIIFLTHSLIGLITATVIVKIHDSLK